MYLKCRCEILFKRLLTCHLVVGAASLARAVSRLKEVRLESAYLRRLQLAALFDTLQLCKEISLTRVELHCNNLAEVSLALWLQTFI